MADQGQEVPKSEVEPQPKLNVVYVEDEAALAELFEFSLNRGNHKVTIFDNPDAFYDAQSKWKESDKPDIVVSDLNISRDDSNDGFDILKAVKAEYPEIPTVLLTARTRIEKSDHPEIDLIITKPYLPSKLQQQLVELVK
jgi:CheY-like chemotaxis protein